MNTLIQAQCSDNPALADALNSALRRLEQIAKVHDRFYKVAATDRIDVAEHISRLLQDLAETLAITPGQVDVRIQAETLLLSPARVIPLALLVGEIATNAFKHAFPDGCTGRLDATLRRSGSYAVLAIEDDGVGLPAQRRPGGLGIELIMKLAAQLGGAASIEPAPAGRGTRVVVTFPVEAPLHSLVS